MAVKDLNLQHRCPPAAPLEGQGRAKPRCWRCPWCWPWPASPTAHTFNSTTPPLGKPGEHLATAHSLPPTQPHVQRPNTAHGLLWVQGKSSE